MVNRSLLRIAHISDEELNKEVDAAFGQKGSEDLLDLYSQHGQRFQVNDIVMGKVTRLMGSDVFVDIGFKSEGTVSDREWSNEALPKPGDTFEVLLESIEEEAGYIILSKRKAERIRAWERIIRENQEGDVVIGEVTRKVKGGLLVDIGTNVFLPASQVDIRRPDNIDEYLGTKIRCLILSIDKEQHNIVVSRRQLIEREREEMKKKLFESLEVGQLRKGMVKNITNFGAFVDLGGVDGLLHVSDMSWSRIDHPSEMLKIDQEIEVVILNIDRQQDRVALGLKQKEPSPWTNIESTFPIGAQVKGEVVNVTNYGAFVKLSEGVEGLVHISEMSWTKRINHPSEMVSSGDEIDVVVLGINRDKQEISLGIKQTQPNPWDIVANKYPVGKVVKGKVHNLTNYGAFIEIEEGIDGLMHVNDMSWVRKVNHPNEVLTKGQELECCVLTVDQERKRIALGLKQMSSDPWETDIPTRFAPNKVVKGKVTKITNFGVFVELEPGLEGLLHVSELGDKDSPKPDQVVKLGDEIECKVLRLDIEERKIALSRKRVGMDEPEVPTESTGKKDKKEDRELKGGVSGGGGLLIDPKQLKGAE